VRHGLVLALTALAAAFAPPAVAADVIVAPAGGEPVTLAISELEASWDVRERPYTLRDADGEQPVVVTGISIDRLLDRAGVDPFAFAGATVSAGGHEVALTREQLVDPAAFPEGRPVFSVDAAGPHFLRPVAGPGDLNAGDRLSGAPITISLAAPGRLRVSAAVSRRRVERGERVTFSARVEGAAEGEAVRVRWTFDDGGTASGTRARHRFRRPGTYKVVVGATSDVNPTGDFAIVTVRVGEPTPGPDREGGGTDEDADAPDSGAATGSGPAPAAPSGTPRGATSERRRRDRPAERRRERPAERRPQPRPERRREPPADRGDEVAGVLLDDPGAPPAASVAAARTGDPEQADALPSSLPDEAVVALTVLALFGFGFWRESRRPLPRRV
jgi:PKD domain